VDRAREVYAGLGWRLDGDFRSPDGSRGIQFTPPGSWCSVQFGTDVTPARVGGRDPEGRTYASFLNFADPDGNGWVLQEVTTRSPGRVEGDTTYVSAADLAQALRRAAAAQGRHEERTGQADENWPDWYAEYMVREQAGRELPT
jgi:hypothetical protein